jgi:hypothetical protein
MKRKWKVEGNMYGTWVSRIDQEFYCDDENEAMIFAIDCSINHCIYKQEIDENHITIKEIIEE